MTIARVPDVMEGMFQFASGRMIVFAQYETSGNRALPRQAFAEFRGTEGALYVSDASYEVLPERGGRYQDDREARMEPINKEFGEGYAQHVRDHVRNFLDCLKTREKPRADVEIGHRSTSMAHLANISLGHAIHSSLGSRARTDHQYPGSKRPVALRVPRTMDAGVIAMLFGLLHVPDED